MASKIVKNNTGSPIIIVDVGNVTIPASGQYTIPPEDYLIWAESSDIITEVGSGDVTVNDGNIDLSIARGVSYLQFGTQQFLTSTRTPETLSLPTANTEDSHTFPAGTKRYIIRNRDDGLLKLAWTLNGTTGTDYVTIWPGGVYEEPWILGGTITVYLQSPLASQTVEFVSFT